MAKKSMPVLRRYTNLAAVIHLLKNKKITLLNPNTWDDKVDVEYMRQCSKLLKYPILALCFCQGPERYHHWRVYANGMDGVCIVFDKEYLLHNLDNRYESLMHDNVTYMSYSEAIGDPPDTLQLPFLKRNAYKDEREYRIVRMFKENDDRDPIRHYDIDLPSITKIVLSPWLPRELCTSVRNVLRSIDGCDALKIYRSALVDDKDWKEFGKDVYDRESNMTADMPDWMSALIPPDNK